MPTIRESFEIDKIQQANVVLSDEEELELREMLNEIISEGDQPVTEEDLLALAGLAFVAGRCYEEQFKIDTVTVPMDVETLVAFTRFLAQGGE